MIFTKGDDCGLDGGISEGESGGGALFGDASIGVCGLNVEY